MHVCASVCVCVCLSIYILLYVCVCVCVFVSTVTLKVISVVAASSGDSHIPWCQARRQTVFPTRVPLTTGETHTHYHTKTHSEHTLYTPFSSGRWKVCACVCSRRAAQTLISYHMSQVMVSNSTSVQRHCLTTKSTAPRPDILATQIKQTKPDNIHHTYVSLKHTNKKERLLFATSFSKRETGSLIRKYILGTRRWFTMLAQRATGGP